MRKGPRCLCDVSLEFINQSHLGAISFSSGKWVIGTLLVKKRCGSYRDTPWFKRKPPFFTIRKALLVFFFKKPWGVLDPSHKLGKFSLSHKMARSTWFTMSFLVRVTMALITIFSPHVGNYLSQNLPYTLACHSHLVVCNLSLFCSFVLSVGKSRLILTTKKNQPDWPTPPPPNPPCPRWNWVKFDCSLLIPALELRTLLSV